jgi:excisionase family DNA binding protein
MRDEELEGQIDAAVDASLEEQKRADLAARTLAKQGQSKVDMDAYAHPRPAMPTPFLTIRSVAEYLSLPLYAVRRMCREGKLVATRIGREPAPYERQTGNRGVLRVTADSLVAYISRALASSEATTKLCKRIEAHGKRQLATDKQRGVRGW